MEISNRNKPVKIGVISLWALTFFLLAFFFYIVGSNQKLFSRKYSIFMFAHDIEGLSPGAFVTLSGLKIGVVGDMSFAERNGENGIIIELKINDKYKSKITPTSKAKIKTMGVLGDKYVDITIGRISEQPLKKGSFITLEKGYDTTDIITSANVTVGKINSSLSDLSRTLKNLNDGVGTLGMLLTDKSVKDSFVDIITNIDNITSKIADGGGSLSRLIEDSTLYVATAHSIQKLDSILGNIEKGEGSLGKLVADTTLYVKLYSIAERTDSILAKAQGEGTIGKLINEDDLHEAVFELTKSLNELTEDIRKHPYRYFTVKIF